MLGRQPNEKIVSDTHVPGRSKRRMLPTVLGIIAVLAVLFLIIVALQPADYQVMRRGTIAAPAAQVFAQVNDLHEFQDWSPWAKLDPDVKNTYEGPSAGTGAITRWTGNKKVGEG